MISKIRIVGLLIAVVLSGLANTANAGDGGIYIAAQGGGLMYSNSQLDSDYMARAAGIGATFTPTSNGDAFGSGTGHPARALIGLQFNSKFAVEVAGINFGTTSYTGITGPGIAPTGTVTATSKTIGSSLNLVSVNTGGQPGDYVTLLVKLGVAALRSTSSIAVSGTMPVLTKTPLGSGRTVGLTFGLGIQSEISSLFAVRLDWDSYVPPSDSTGRFHTIVLGLSMKLF